MAKARMNAVNHLRSVIGLLVLHIVVPENYT